MKMSPIGWIAFILVVIGGLNWGLIGFFNYNLVGSITGGDVTTTARVIYALVGLSALYMILKGFMKPKMSSSAPAAM